MPSQVPTSTTNNAGGPAHTHASPAAAKNRARQRALPYRREDQPRNPPWPPRIPGAG